MSLYLLKPIVWNQVGYKRPGGGKFMSGYPAKNGFGHEEWNNAVHLTFHERGKDWRIFHTEGVGSQDVDGHDGDIVVFMIASHGGKQYLVGVAGNSTCLLNNKSERTRLVSIVRSDSMKRAKEAWILPQVRKCFKDDWGGFLAKWQSESHWVPTWKCLAENFAWLDTPLLLDPRSLTGKNRLVTMYSTYQAIHRYQATGVLKAAVGVNPSVHTLLRVLDYCTQDKSEEDEDITEIARAPERSIDSTEKSALILARRGQGIFRDRLFQIWGGCAVTGCSQPHVLRASHIMPWRACSNAERLDPQNGLLLVANLDALFDAGMIAFNDDGSVLVSKRVRQEERRQLSLSDNLSLRLPLQVQMKDNLSYHRRMIFRDE